MNKYTQTANILTLYEYKNNSKFFIDYYDFDKITTSTLGVEIHALVTGGEWETICTGHQANKTIANHHNNQHKRTFVKL